MDRGASGLFASIDGAGGAVPPHHKESFVKLHHRLILLPLLAAGPALLASCGSTGSNSPQQQPSVTSVAPPGTDAMMPHTTDAMAPHTTDAMMPHTTDAMMPHPTDAMAPATTGG
jgi:hypothetical protein